MCDQYIIGSMKDRLVRTEEGGREGGRKVQGKAREPKKEYNILIIISIRIIRANLIEFEGLLCTRYYSMNF